ncbi:hypothetical protein Tco_0488718 [Tanacetum coccineum]
MSNKTHMTQEHLTAEALLDEERARNPKTPQKRRTNVNSCPTQILPVQFTEDAMGISKWAGPVECRQYSYNPMNNWMTQQEESTTANNYDPSQPSTSQGYMFHQLKGESSTPYESYHLDDL